MVKLSVVVPIFNEEENIVALHQEIDEVCRKENYEYEIIFVDDGSTDSTYELSLIHIYKEPFDEVVYAEDLHVPVDNIKWWIFTHTVVEICTAVKGQACLLYTSRCV